jgi:DNA-binding LacI/PurR family transcriptional regulator
MHNRPDLGSTGHRRYRPVGAALASAGVRHRTEHVRLAGFDEAVARRRMLELLHLPEAPTAVFVGSDRRPLGIYEALAERELRVPGRHERGGLRRSTGGPLDLPGPHGEYDGTVMCVNR